MVFLPDSEKERRLHAAHRYIDSEPHGSKFSKDDLRISSKTYYYVPSEHMHKSVNDLPEEVMRLMAYQGHRRRSSRDNMISMSNRKDSFQGLLSNIGSPTMDSFLADDFLSGLHNKQPQVKLEQPVFNNVQVPLEQQPMFNNTQAPLMQQPLFNNAQPMYDANAHVSMKQPAFNNAHAPLMQQPMYDANAQQPLMQQPIYTNNANVQAPLMQQDMQVPDRFEQVITMLRDTRASEQRELEKLRMELEAAKRRIAELEQDALSFREISQFMKRQRVG